MANNRRYKRTLLITVIVVGIFIIATAGGYVYWNSAPPHKTCLSCHEITNSFDMWARSSHRDIHCKTCHGTALSNGWHSIQEKSNMVINHFREEYVEDIRLSEEQIFEMMDNCKSCHQNQYAKWLSGGHSMKYSDVFLNVTHNETEQINDDCLRCHGMFFEGTVHDIVEPLNMEGPWRLLREDLAGKPTMPCLTCHSIHEENLPTTEPVYDDPNLIHYQRMSKSPTVGFWDRHEQDFYRAEILPEPTVIDYDRKVKLATDDSQKMCTVCHSPNSFHMSGSGDDRTPRGVHEGLACNSCHVPHSNDSKRSCQNCHPAISNCGLDVTSMNTTFANQQSPHDIHFVGCKDCHPEMLGK